MRDPPLVLRGCWAILSTAGDTFFADADTLCTDADALLNTNAGSSMVAGMLLPRMRAYLSPTWILCTSDYA